jgi:hypothetical protein
LDELADAAELEALAAEANVRIVIDHAAVAIVNAAIMDAVDKLTIAERAKCRVAVAYEQSLEFLFIEFPQSGPI